MAQGGFHRRGLTLQLANPRLRDNRGLSPACVPSLSDNLTAHLTCNLTSFRYTASVIGCRGHVSTRSGHINYNNYCSAFDQRNGFGYDILFLARSIIEKDSLILMDFSFKTIDSSTHNTTTIILPHRGPVPSSRVKLTRRLTFDLTLG